MVIHPPFFVLETEILLGCRNGDTPFDVWVEAEICPDLTLECKHRFVIKSSMQIAQSQIIKTIMFLPVQI